MMCKKTQRVLWNYNLQKAIIWITLKTVVKKIHDKPDRAKVFTLLVTKDFCFIEQLWTLWLKTLEDWLLSPISIKVKIVSEVRTPLFAECPTTS